MAKVTGDARAALWIALFAGTFLLLFHRAAMVGSDEFGVYHQTASLVERGDLAIPPQAHAFPGHDGRIYSVYAVGQAVLALPLYALGEIVEQWGPRRLNVLLSGPGLVFDGRPYRSPHLFTVMLLPIAITAGIAAVLFLFQRLMGVGPGWSAVAALAITLTTYVAYMSGFFLRHSAETAVILAAFYCFARFERRGGIRLLVLGSSFASLTFLIRVPSAIIAVPMAAYLAWVLQRRFRLFSDRAVWKDPAWLRALGALAGPVALGLAVHVFTGALRWGRSFGGPLWDHASYFSTPLSFSGVANLFSPGSSVFLYSPLLLLVPAVHLAVWRRERPLVLLGLGCFLVLWAFFSRYDFWTGLWSAPGPRYLTAAVPLLLLPLGLWLERASPPWRAAFFALAGLGLTFQVALLSTSWVVIVRLFGYETMGSPDFPFAFIFVPEKSPVWAALQLFFSGRGNTTWLVQLAHGWHGFEGAPAAAAALAGAWLLAMVLCGMRLKGALSDLSAPPRDAEPGG